VHAGGRGRLPVSSPRVIVVHRVVSTQISGGASQDGVMRDWVAWHQAYADPASGLSMRLRSVQRHVSRAIDHAVPGPVRLVSLWAGQGHDVLGVLACHPRRDEVAAVLVEADPRNAELARRRATAAGLDLVQVRRVDASRPRTFADALPADVLLLCGIFGNASDTHIERTAAAARRCALRARRRSGPGTAGRRT
jgi:hypothetical protein